MASALDEFTANRSAKGGRNLAYLVVPGVNAPRVIRMGAASRSDCKKVESRIGVRFMSSVPLVFAVS
jgi:hypothetical protein